MPVHESDPPTLPWLPEDPEFPPPSEAWGPDTPAPGLLAAGGSLRTRSLLKAYAQGTFPWFSEGQPILWWAPDPRMVLDVDAFKLHPSLKKTLGKFRRDPNCCIRVDSAFDEVIHSCASTQRPGQRGTWIVPEMRRAYGELHRKGYAHSIETWINGELTGGLYCVALGKAVFGESMFSRKTDASKIALAALVCIARRNQVPWIDCQQNTSHLASLGAREISRDIFLDRVQQQRQRDSFTWKFESVYWSELLIDRASSA